ncbi:sigma-70 family RNA polymerase sigma factor [Jonesiaceae bacterium BS-20]|uniref:Sigma-70 family RNA polymerase sigma factor n=1 Tax=Jonesiaceae bacterium BS-20 TaxID=3120821 RepID=A0AAU7DYK8_9MICO
MKPVSAAAKTLIESHLHIVGYHVSEMLVRVPAQVTRDELASAGYLALTQAAIGYDPETGVPFSRFAAIRIKGALIDELRSMDWVSRGTRRKIREYTKTVEQITSTLRRVPSRNEIATALGIDVSEVSEIADHASVKVLSVDAYDGSLADIMPSSEPTPESSALQSERYTYLRGAVAALPERLRHVVEQVFFHDVPVAQVAQEMGVTASRISQLRSEAMVLLRDGMNTHLNPDRVPAEPAKGVVARRRAHYFDEIQQRVTKVSGSSDRSMRELIYRSFVSDLATGPSLTPPVIASASAREHRLETTFT